MDACDFWNGIRLRLEDCGKDIKWLALECGISVFELKDLIEMNRWPGTECLYGISHALGADAGELLRGELNDCGASATDAQNLRDSNAQTAGEMYYVPVLAQHLSAGYGQYVPEADEIVEYVGIPQFLRKYGKKMFALRVSGDSMEPTLHDGQVVVCDGNGFDGSDGIFAVRLCGKGFVKRIQRSGKKIRILSDNGEYDAMEEPAESEDLQVIGKIRHALSENSLT